MKTSDRFIGLSIAVLLIIGVLTAMVGFHNMDLATNVFRFTYMYDLPIETLCDVNGFGQCHGYEDVYLGGIRMMFFGFLCMLGAGLVGLVRSLDLIKHEW